MKNYYRTVTHLHFLIFYFFLYFLYKYLVDVVINMHEQSFHKLKKVNIKVKEREIMQYTLLSRKILTKTSTLYDSYYI